MVVRSLQRWLPQNHDQTVAVLAPENHRGFALTEALDKTGLPFDDSLLRTDITTRAAAQALATVLHFIAAPQSAGVLQPVWAEVWYPALGAAPPGRRRVGDGALPASSSSLRKTPLPEPVKTFSNALGKLRETEAFVFPDNVDWLAGVNWIDDIEGFQRHG